MRLKVLVTLAVFVISVAGCEQTNQALDGNVAMAKGKKSEGMTISDSGEKTTREFQLEKGLAIFEMKHDGNKNFMVALVNTEGGEEMLANARGAFDGAKAKGIKKPGTYRLNILKADGKWSVTIKQPEDIEPETPPVKFKGVGQQVTPFFKTKGGVTHFNFSHSGRRPFIVFLFTPEGERQKLLVHKKPGSFSGSKETELDEGIYLLDIMVADGKWKIKVK